MGSAPAPFEIVVMRAKAPGTLVLPGDRDRPSISIGGSEYVRDPVGLVRLPDPVDSRLANPPLSSVQLLRGALRSCIRDGVPESRIVEIVNLELDLGIVRDSMDS